MEKILNVSEIRAEQDLQPRCGMTQEVIEEYSEILDQLPPIDVVYDGVDYWLWDGWHRLDAAIEAGVDTITANVVEGTREDAAMLAVSANAKHGLRRTNADKRRAVQLALRLEKGPDVIRQRPSWPLWCESSVCFGCS